MIIKAALLLFRDNNGTKELLFARAKGKDFYVFPGGKQEDGETIDEALQRELQEELGTTASNIQKLGIVTGKTPDGRDMEMHLYFGSLESEPSSQSEIEEIEWMSELAIAEKKITYDAHDARPRSSIFKVSKYLVIKCIDSPFEVAIRMK